MLAAPAAAEQGYFTWVDEMGRVHNSPAPTLPPKNDSKPVVKSLPQSDSNAEQPFLSEEELQQQLEKDRKERPPFYTWMDGQGQLRSQPIPQVVSDDDDTQTSELSDHTLLPLYRLLTREEIRCCEQYQARFKTQLLPFKSVLLSKPEFSANFSTQSGLSSAWYVHLPVAPNNTGDAIPQLLLKLRGSEDPLALIALDQHFKPLHFLSPVLTQLHPETWRAVAYHESIISLADPEVVAFILYFPQRPPKHATIEVQWQP